MENYISFSICQTKSTKNINTENTLAKILDLNEDGITSLDVASNISSDHNINSIIQKQLKTKDDFLTAIKTINERNNRIKILTLNASENVHRPPRVFFEDKRSTETAPLDFVSSQFVPNIFSEDMNDEPLVLIPLTIFKALCSTYDSSQPDQNRYQGMQNDKITKKPICEHAFEERKEKNGTVDTSKVFNNEQRYVQTSVQPLFCQEYYEPWGITYKGIQLVDVPQTNITIYFNEVVDFIDQALAAGGKVLVNCEMGMSRSSTCVLAYLMLRHNMTAVNALIEVDIESLDAISEKQFNLISGQEAAGREAQ